MQRHQYSPVADHGVSTPWVFQFHPRLKGLRCEAQAAAVPGIFAEPANAWTGLRERLRGIAVDACAWYKASKFMLVGASGIVVNTLALSLFYAGAHLPLLLASAAAVEVAIIYNFLLNNRWTFGHRDLSLRRFTKFNFSALLGLVVTTSALLALVHLGVQYMVANLIAIGASGVVSLAGANWTWGFLGR